MKSSFDTLQMSALGRKQTLCSIRTILLRALHHSENIEHSQRKWCYAQMVLGTFAETKVPRP